MKTPFPTPSALAGGGLALILLVAAWVVLTATPDRVRHPLPAVAQAVPGVAAPAIAQARPAKTVYRNSVIPGGVHSAAELSFALANDAVAAAHYAGFDVAAAHVVRVAQSRLVHVSYRIGDNIYWTKHNVRLAAGEELLSDGTHLVRARCGNRIADEPQGPILDKEPAPEVLDALMVSADGLVDDQPASFAAVSNLLPVAAPASGERPPEVRLASTLQAGAPSPFIASLTPTGGGTFTLSAPPVSAHVPVLAPSEAALADTGVDAIVVAAASPVAATPPAPDSPAEFPLGPTMGAQSTLPATAPPAPAQVPESGSAMLAAAALAALALVRRRTRRAATQAS